jgi:hypothetical protein
MLCLASIALMSPPLEVGFLVACEDPKEVIRGLPHLVL